MCKDITYFGNLFFSLGDYPAQMSLNGFKESVAATHFCHLCDIQHDNLQDDICYDFEPITLSQYRERFVSKNSFLTLNTIILVVTHWS